MAELLLYARDDERRGEIIDGKPDGFAWGGEERLGVFLVVRADVPVETRGRARFWECFSPGYLAGLEASDVWTIPYLPNAFIEAV